MLGASLKAAFDAGEISREALFSDDSTVLSILEASTKENVRVPLEDLKANRLPDGSKAKFKVRYVDPAVATELGTKKLSELDPVYAMIVKENEKKLRGR